MRVWNKFLVAFAGYEEEEGGKVVGDKGMLEFTKV